MPNVFDYLAWRGDLPFSAAPFNPADSLILSRLSYLPLDGAVSSDFEDTVTLREAAEVMLSRLRHYRLEEDVRLLRSLASAPRFQCARLSGFVSRFDPAEEKQFAAICIQLEGELPYIAFRGTDGTLVGWKEDFNMAFNATVPAQRDAVAYLNGAAAALHGRLRAGGHSKGGNLAVYASAFCDAAVQMRMEAVYNHDGPGFLEETLLRPEFEHIRRRVHTFVPQSSVVGMFLRHDEEITVVRSTNTFLLQHDLYSWETAAHGLAEAEIRTGSSRYIDSTIKSWLLKLSPEDRNRFVDGMYGAMVAAGAVTVADLRKPRMAVAILREVRQMDEQTREVIRQGLGLLNGSAREALRQARSRVR